jgi:hypothetical protein
LPVQTAVEDKTKPDFKSKRVDNRKKVVVDHKNSVEV